MTDPTFGTLWENVDFSLLKVRHILQGAQCVSGHGDRINETLDTLISLALDHVTETRKHLFAMHKHNFTAAPDSEDAEA